MLVIPTIKLEILDLHGQLKGGGELAPLKDKNPLKMILKAT